MSPLHDPDAFRLSVYYTPICRCNMSLQNDPSYLPTFKDFSFAIFFKKHAEKFQMQSPS